MKKFIHLSKEKLILYFCSTTHAFTHAVMLSIPPLIALIRQEFGFSYTQVFTYVTISGMLYGFGAVPAGYMADKWGSLKTIQLGIAVSVAGLMGLFFSSSIPAFALFLIIIGMGSSVYHPSGLNAISKAFAAKRGDAMGKHGFIGNFGQVIAPTVVAFLGAQFGWRSGFLLWGALGVLLLIWNLYLTKSKAEESKKETFSQDYFGSLRRVINFAVGLVLVLTILRGLYYRGTVTITPSYITDVLGRSVMQAGLLTSLLLGTGGVAQLIGGRWVDKLGTKKPIIIFTILSVVSLSFIVIASNSYILMVGIVLFGFSFFGAQPAVNTLIAEIAHESIRGGFYGLTFLTRFGMSFLSPLLAGVIADNFGLTYPYYMFIFFTVLALGSIFLITSNRSD